MKKIKQFKAFDDTFKIYSSGIKTLSELVNKIQASDIDIKYIEKSEGVELDMQTYGSVSVTYEEYLAGKLSEYHGDDETTSIVGEYQGEKITIYTQFTDWMGLMSENPELELPDIFLNR